MKERKKKNLRNSDRIKQLENLLAHERKQIAELRWRNEGLLRWQLCLDAILYRFAEKYGEERREDDGTLIGWHMVIPKPDIVLSKAR
jgi:hypothetical protein